MNELIKVNYDDNSRPTVSGRELHKALNIDSNYTTWFKRMCEYGFVEGVDYVTCFPNLESENQHGGQNKTDHLITLDMAKHICMIQRSPKGKAFREYFIEVEKAWNDPKAILARALQAAQTENLQLTEKVQTLETTVNHMKPMADYTRTVLRSDGLLTATQIAKEYGMNAKEFNRQLYTYGVQYPQSGQWLLYAKYADKGYAKTETAAFTHRDGTPGTKHYLKWTERGKAFIYTLFKSKGILPVTEREEVQTAPLPDMDKAKRTTRWTQTDVNRLIDLYHEGYRVSVIAKELGRTNKAVEEKVKKLKIRRDC